MTGNPAPTKEGDDSLWHFGNRRLPMSRQLRNGVTGEVFYRHNSPVLPTEWVYLPDRGAPREVLDIDHNRSGQRCIIVDLSGRQVRYLESQVRRKNLIK